MRNKPTAVDGLADATVLAAGAEHTCAARRAGPVVCWGKNAAGQLGNGKHDDSPRPVGVAGNLSNVSQLSLGTTHSCALAAGRRIFCWGGNFFGQVGSGHTVGFAEMPSPTGVLKVDDAVEVAAGDDHTCARRATGADRLLGEGRPRPARRQHHQQLVDPRPRQGPQRRHRPRLRPRLQLRRRPRPQ
jgi:alpha-tubulin suppressor-like RCC1 family protein